MEASASKVEEENSEAISVNVEKTQTIENPDEQQMGDAESKPAQEPPAPATTIESESDLLRKEQLKHLEKIERDYSYQLDKDASKSEHDKENASITGDEPNVEHEKALTGNDELPKSEEKTETHVETNEPAASPLEEPNDDDFIKPKDDIVTNTACDESVSKDAASVEHEEPAELELKQAPVVPPKEDELKEPLTNEPEDEPPEPLPEDPKQLLPDDSKKPLQGDPMEKESAPASENKSTDVVAKQAEVTPTKKKEDGRFHNHLMCHSHSLIFVYLNSF